MLRSNAVRLVVLGAVASGLSFACSKSTPSGPPPGEAPVAGVRVGPDSTRAFIGQTVQLQATPVDSTGKPLTDRAVHWASSDPSIATVDDSGVVTTLLIGTVTITASSESKTGTAKVVVTHPSGAWATKIILVMLENRDYGDVIGNSSAPYINSLATTYAQATSYYAVTHPSIGNYFMLTTGDTITNNDDWGTTLTQDNIVRHLLAAGRTWRSYSEGLPSVGYLGNYDGNYARHHNPPSYFSDVVNSSEQLQNLQPFSTFPGDLAAGQLRDWTLIDPNICSDGHDCDLATVDSWMKSNIDPLIRSAQFQRDELLIITWDESRTSTTNGGGRVPFILVGPLVKKGYSSSVTYNHASLLRMMMKALGLSGYPGRAASAKDMDEFFTP